MTMRDGVEIVVPMFNPGPEAIGNLEAMVRQAPVVAVDDGSSPAFSATLDAIASIEGVRLVRLGENRGIAAALNVGIRAALDRGVDYVVTFDQDTHPSGDHVARVCAVVGQALCVAGPGIAGGAPVDPAVRDATPSPVAVHTLYQSGMAIPRRVIDAVGLMDEKLFIDSVDTDFCLRVRAVGGRVLALADLQTDHVLGAGHTSFRRVRVGPFTPVATFHSPDRRYYITRNLIWMLARHGRRERRWAFVTMRRSLGSTVLAVTVEDRRIAKLRAVLDGVLDAMRGRSGRRRTAR